MHAYVHPYIHTYSTYIHTYPSIHTYIHTVVYLARRKWALRKHPVVHLLKWTWTSAAGTAGCGPTTSHPAAAHCALNKIFHTRGIKKNTGYNIKTYIHTYIHIHILWCINEYIQTCMHTYIHPYTRSTNIS